MGSDIMNIFGCFTVFAAAFAIFVLPGDASAQSSREAAAEEARTSLEDLSAEDIRKMAEQYARENAEAIEYVEPNYENVSKLYWALGVFDPVHDTRAVNGYLKINECEIYSEYFNDDFEWNKIFSATTEFLKSNRKNFPRRFQFTRMIELGRYDFDKDAFLVGDPDLVTGSRQYDMNLTHPADKVCGTPGSVENYPRDIVVVLSRPFKLAYLPATEDIAQDFVARTTHQNFEDNMDLNKNYQRSAYSRVAFLNVRVRIIKHMGLVYTSAGRQAAKVFGILEGYDVWEDPKGKRVLFSTRNATTAAP